MSAVKKAVGLWLILELGAAAALLLIATRKTAAATPEKPVGLTAVDPVLVATEYASMPTETKTRVDSALLRLGSFTPTGSFSVTAITDTELAEIESLASELEDQYPQSATALRVLADKAHQKTVY